jgi:NAD-dependent SIR2 family protein deacetylase
MKIHLVFSHGSFKTAKCIVCGYSVDGKEIEEDIFKKVNFISY